MQKIVLINGKKRAGKDYVARILQQELNKCGLTSCIESFADPIKDIIATTLGLTLSELDNFKNKKSLIVINGKEVCDARLMLQRFGTEAMKSWFGDDVWAKLLYENIKNIKADVIIVPDFRFNVEKRKNTFTLKVVNDNVDKACDDNHQSENELNDFKFDHVIDNTGYKDITTGVNIVIKEMLL